MNNFRNSKENGSKKRKNDARFAYILDKGLKSELRCVYHLSVEQVDDAGGVAGVAL